MLYWLDSGDVISYSNIALNGLYSHYSAITFIKTYPKTFKYLITSYGELWTISVPNIFGKLLVRIICVRDIYLGS